MFALFYIWAIGTMALFTLAFISSYDVDSGYRQTLSVAALSIAWPAVVAAIVLLLTLILLLQLRDAVTCLVASRRRKAMTRHGWRRIAVPEEPVHCGERAAGVEAGALRRLANTMRAHR